MQKGGLTPIEDSTNGMVEWERANEEENNHAETPLDSPKLLGGILLGGFMDRGERKK
jgi:hypothetical protein